MRASGAKNAMTPYAKTRPVLLSFAQQFRRVRVAAKISQRELGRRTGVGHKFISTMELGRENPSLQTIVLLALGVGCELSDLFPPDSRRLG